MSQRSRNVTPEMKGEEPREHTTVVLQQRGSILGKLGAIAAIVVGLVVLALVLAAVHILPQLRNPFGETTTDRSQPVVLKSISQLSRYEAASGSFEVVVDLKSHSLLPSFIEGSDTLFVGQGTDIAYVDFSELKGQAIQVNADRTAVTVALPKAQLEPAVLNVHQSYVFAQQEGVANRIGNFFSGNPNNQQKVYEAAQTKIQNAAKSSQLLAQAQKNTQAMMTGMLKSLGFQQVTVNFGQS